MGNRKRCDKKLFQKKIIGMDGKWRIDEQGKLMVQESGLTGQASTATNTSPYYCASLVNLLLWGHDYRNYSQKRIRPS